MTALSPVLRDGGVFAERYSIDRPLAEGGMGVVYQATHLATRRSVALKIMHRRLVADAELRARFDREAQITAAIRSEHLVPVIDAGVDEVTGMPFLVMELLEGEDLSHIVERRGALPPADALRFLEQAARGLDKLHAGGVVHRDLKPENLFVTYRDDGTPWLKIIDFGIAKQADPSPDARTTRVTGTPLYMSPEQVLGLGDVGRAADLYALGQITFDLLVGRSYFADEAASLGPSLRFLQQIVAGLPERASVRAGRLQQPLPLGFDHWFARATALDPTQRFGTAQEQVAALRRLFGGAHAFSSVPVDPFGSTAAEEGAAPEPPRQADLGTSVEPAAPVPPLEARTVVEPAARGARGRPLVVGAVLLLVAVAVAVVWLGANTGVTAADTASPPDAEPSREPATRSAAPLDSNAPDAEPPPRAGSASAPPPRASTSALPATSRGPEPPRTSHASGTPTAPSTVPSVTPSATAGTSVLDER